MTYFNIGYLVLLITVINIDYTIADVQYQQHNGKIQEEVSEEVSEIDFPDVTGSDKHTIQRYKRNTLNGIADIERFVVQSTRGTEVYKVYVDDTMTQLLITVISTKGIPLLNITKPSGSVMKNTSTMKNITKLSNGSSIVSYTLPISQPTESGIWNISRNDNNPAEVIIQGKSPVSVKHQFYELGSNIPINNGLFASKQYHLKITVTGINKIGNISIGHLVARNTRNFKKDLSFTNINDNIFEIFNASILAEPFYVGIQGIDKTSHIIQRIDPTLLEPIVYRIDVYPDTGAKIYENSTLNITYTIQCYVTKNKPIKVNINDTMGLIQSPTNDVSMSCIAGKNVTNFISMKADNIDGPTILTIRILYWKRGVYTEGLVVHKTYTVVPNITNLHGDMSQSPQSDTPIGAIVGGVVGALLVLLAIVVGIIIYKKIVAKRNAVSQIGNNVMPTNTQYKPS